MPSIDRIKGIAIGLIALSAAIVALGVTIPGVIEPTCDNAHTLLIIKETVCRLD